MTAMRCLCASVVAFLLNGRSSSVPKPGIHMFQFLSRTIWIWISIMFESVTTIFYLYIPHIDVIGLPVLGKGAGLADSMLYEVISNLKRKHSTTTKRAEKLVPRTQCGVIPEGGRLPHPRPAAQPDQLPLPAHTAFSCPKPFTWFEVKLFTT